MLRGASKDQQLLLSTHSVPLINRLSLKDLVLVERGKDGGTTARRVEEKAELEAALKDWALGEAYASGILDAA
jgi:predicted ATPase